MANPQIRFPHRSDAASYGADRTVLRAADADVLPVNSPARALQDSVATRLAAQAEPELWSGAARVAVIMGGGVAAWGLAIGTLRVIF